MAAMRLRADDPSRAAPRRPRRDRSPTTAPSTGPSTASTRASRRHVAAQRRRRRQARLARAPARRSGSSRSTARHAGSLALTDEGDGLGGAALVRARSELRGQRPRPPAGRRAARRAPSARLRDDRPRDLQRPARRRAHLPLTRLRAALGARPARAGAASSSPTSATSSASRRGPSPRSRPAPARARGPSRSARRRRAPACRRGRERSTRPAASSSRRRRESSRSERPGTLDGELGEVVRAVGERPEDRAGPAAADQLDRGVEIGTDRCAASPLPCAGAPSARGCSPAASTLRLRLPDPLGGPRGRRSRSDARRACRPRSGSRSGCTWSGVRRARAYRRAPWRRPGSGTPSPFARPPPVEAAKTVVDDAARRGRPPGRRSCRCARRRETGSSAAAPARARRSPGWSPSRCGPAAPG